MAKKIALSYTAWPKPIFSTIVRSNKNFRGNFHAGLMYAHTEMSAIELKKEVAKYLKSLDSRHPFLDKIKDIDDNRFLTIGKYMYLLNNGAELPEDVMCKVAPALEKILYEDEVKVAEAEKERKFLESQIKGSNEANSIAKVIPTIQDRLRERAKEVALEIEAWIDEFCTNKSLAAKSVEDFVNLFKIHDLKAQHVRHMNGIFANRSAEITEALTGDDKMLSDGYKNFSKQELKKFELFYLNLFKAIAMQQEVAKVERAPVKKKPVSSERLVAKLKYKKDDSALGIVSVNPVQLVGASEAWVYNCKTRKLIHFKSVDERGFSVKGTSLLNVSSESIEKGLKKPAEVLAEFKKTSKVKLRTFMKEIQSVDTTPNGKFNDNHVILRIDK